MTDGVTSDFTDMFQLAANLGEVAKEAGPNIAKAVTVTSLKIKRGWQNRLKGSETLPGLPNAVTFDITSAKLFGFTVIKSDIGFDKERSQGALGNISEFGSPTIAPRGYGLASLLEQQDDFETGLDIALRQTEKKAGL